MYQNRRRASSGLLEWSMFDHDHDTPPDEVCEIDDSPNCSQPSNMELSPTSSCAIEDTCSDRTVAWTSDEFFQDGTAPASQEIQAVYPTSAARTVSDSLGSVFGASASCAPTRKKRKTRSEDFSTCEIDDASNDESASPPPTRCSVTIDETTDDELVSSPSCLSPLKRPQPISMTGSRCQQGSREPDTSSCPLRESALKNGFQESLIIAVQKMNSDLAVWNCYKSNASFPKRLVSGGPAPLTARIVFTEALYGSTYCTCHLVDSESDNSAETLSLVFPSEVSENEGFRKDTVLRVHPPWREYAVESEPSKVLTAIQFYEVLDRGGDGKGHLWQLLRAIFVSRQQPTARVTANKRL